MIPKQMDLSMLCNRITKTITTTMILIWKLSLALALRERQALSRLMRLVVRFLWHFRTLPYTNFIFCLDYFREAHGRVFPLDQNLPLTYPVDDIETRRHQMQHTVTKSLMHGNYIGPVREVLKPRVDGSRPRILDIRTCAGDWCVSLLDLLDRHFSLDDY